MRKLNLFMALTLTVFSLMSVPVWADNIVELRGTTVRLYDKEGSKTGSIPKDMVELPLKVEGKSEDERYLLVIIGDDEHYLNRNSVTLDGESENITGDDCHYAQKGKAKDTTALSSRDMDTVIGGDDEDDGVIGGDSRAVKLCK